MPRIHIVTSTGWHSYIALTSILALLVHINTDKHCWTSGTNVKRVTASGVNAPFIIGDDIASSSRAARAAPASVRASNLAGIKFG